MRRCDFCGGKFGLIVHRQWGRRFCKLACKRAHQSRPHENLQSRRQCDAQTLSGKLRYVLSLAAVFGTASATLAMAQHPAHHEAVSSVQHHLPITAHESDDVAPEPNRRTRLSPVYYEPTPVLFNAYTYGASVQLAASGSNHKLQGEFRFPRFSAAPNVSVQIIASISAVPMQVSAVQVSETVGASGSVETKIVVEAETIFDVPASGSYYANLIVTQSFRGTNQNLLGSHIEPLADPEDMRIMITFSSNVRIATALAVAVLPAAFPAASAQAADTEVKIDHHAFIPQRVAVKAGTAVTWINDDDVPHTVASSAKLFKSKALDTGDKFSFTFTTPGAYQYFCSVHPYMTGAIVVEAATGSSAAQ